jgi:hypothetical protein
MWARVASSASRRAEPTVTPLIQRSPSRSSLSLCRRGTDGRERERNIFLLANADFHQVNQQKEPEQA